MTLFEETYREEAADLISFIGEEWASVLTGEELLVMKEMLKKVRKESVKNTVCPTYDKVYNALKFTPYNKVKAVILGQDPYHDGNANGFAFSCSNTITPSVKVMLERLATSHNMRKDQIFNSNRKYPYKLRGWVKEGVLLLNTKFTVLAGKPNSHEGFGWDRVVSAVLHKLSKRGYLVWILLGKHAQEYADIIPKKHGVIKAEHPAYAARENRAWNFDGYKQTNMLLEKQNIQKINWLR